MSDAAIIMGNLDSKEMASKKRNSIAILHNNGPLETANYHQNVALKAKNHKRSAAFDYRRRSLAVCTDFCTSADPRASPSTDYWALQRPLSIAKPTSYYNREPAEPAPVKRVAFDRVQRAERTRSVQNLPDAKEASGNIYVKNPKRYLNWPSEFSAKSCKLLKVTLVNNMHKQKSAESAPLGLPQKAQSSLDLTE